MSMTELITEHWRNMENNMSITLDPKTVFVVVFAVFNILCCTLGFILGRLSK